MTLRPIDLWTFIFDTNMDLKPEHKAFINVPDYDKTTGSPLNMYVHGHLDIVKIVDLINKHFEQAADLEEASTFLGGAST